MSDESGTLAIGEYHPSADIAVRFIRENDLEMTKLIEPLASCALAGNRMAEVCYETWRRFSAGEPVSDRYIMGLAWFLWQIKNDGDR